MRYQELQTFLRSKNLSEREIEVSIMTAQGLSNREIGNALFVTEKTIKFHLANVFKKLSLTSRARLIVMCLPMITNDILKKEEEVKAQVAQTVVHNPEEDGPKTNVGRFYTQFEDETWECAVLCHGEGFTSVQEAVEEANSEPNPTKFFVKDHNGNVVHEGVTPDHN